MAITLKYMISFDNEEWRDISKFVKSENTTLKKGFLSSDYKSSINTLKFSLIGKPHRASNINEHASLFLDIVDTIVASNNVYIAFYESDEMQFKGVVDTGGLSQKISSHPEEISITAYDFVYLLDKDMTTAFEYPENFTVDAEGWYVFKDDVTNTEKDIVVSLITSAGFDITDIDFDNSSPVLKNDNSGDYRTCRHISDDEDSTRTYKDILSTLLHENCKVLTTGKDGRFIITDMYQKTYEPKYLDYSYMINSDSLSMKLSTRKEDGVLLYWSELNTMKKVLLYDGNLGGTIKDDGSGFEGGTEINGGDYWPETSDIEEIWEEYSSSWLDRPYYTASSRIKNEDLSLLSAKNIFYEAYKDNSIILDKGYPYTEPLKAMFRFKNTSDDVAEFHKFSIYGEALFRYKINDYTFPSTATGPEEYTAEFIYSAEQAQEYTIVTATLKNYGIMQYTWSMVKDINEGEIWHITPRGTKISTDVVITSVTYKYFGGIKYYYVTAQGYGDYSTTEIRKRAKQVGVNTGTVGKDGATGESVTVEYAKNTSAYEPPEGDTLYKFGDYLMYFKGRPIGVANWTRTSPSADSLEDNEYIWQRNSV